MKKLGFVLVMLFAIVLLCAHVDAQASEQIHYDDEDGHREPWIEWKEADCVSEPCIIMDSSPDCNSNTGLGITVWMCNDGSDDLRPWSYYTTHWFCEPPIIGDAIKRIFYYLSFIQR